MYNDQPEQDNFNSEYAHGKGMFSISGNDVVRIIGTKLFVIFKLLEWVLSLATSTVSHSSCSQKVLLQWYA